MTNLRRNLVLTFGMLGVLVMTEGVFAQAIQSVRQAVVKREASLVGRAHSQAPHAADATTDQPTYNYTLISFPGTLNTLGVGINLGAIRESDRVPSLELVGAEFFPDGLSQTGFSAHASRTNGVTEGYKLLNDPQVPTPQQAYSVNDVGQVVGDYIDAAGVFHSYMFDCDRFTSFDVPFSGATGTYSPAINNAGEIVGSWNDSAGNAHSYTLKNGKFVSFDYPGASQAQFYYGINSEGEITGSYADANGNIHGFLRKGSDYTSINFPGAVYTATSGINDAGEIVGGYCLTSECVNTGEGEVGFILKDGIYTTITIPGEFEVALASVDNKGILMGNYVDAAGLVYTFLATPK